MKKKSILFLVPVSFVVAISIFIFYSYLNDLKDEYASITKIRSEKLVEVLKALPKNPKSIRVLEKTLDEKIQYKVIDYYVIRDASGVLSKKNVGEITDDQQRALDQINEVLVYDKTVFASVKRGSNTVTVGFNRNWPAFQQEGMKLVIRYWFQDSVIYALLLIGLLMYFFKDIFKIIKNFERRDRRPLSDVKATSIEADRLIRAIEGYEERVKNLESSLQIFEKQVFDGVREEMRQGRQPPYRFDCVMVRTDLSDFSSARKRSDPQLFERLIDDFFTSLMVMISRHGGYTAEFLGDELIYYFKLSEHPYAVAQAVSCQTDLNLLADQYSERSRAEMGFELKLKTALCVGEIEVRAATRQIEFRGEPLIESVRILKEVVEKNRHVILYNRVLRKDLDMAGRSLFYKSTDLKGIGAIDLFEFQSRFAVHELLGKLSRDTLHYLSFLRSTSDLVETFDYLDLCRENIDNGLMLKILARLKQSIAQVTDNREVIQSYKQLIRHLHEDYCKQKNPDSLHVLSAAVTLCPFVMSRFALAPEFQGLLTEIALEGDPRVFANTIDVYIRMEESLPAVLTKGLSVSKNNRVIANSLIFEGQKELSSAVLSKTETMINDDNPYYIASGLYAIGEIAHFYRSKNLVYLKANLTVERILQKVANFLDHNDEMVRRQSLQAAKKSDDATLLAAVKAYQLKSQIAGRQDRLNEISAHFEQNAAPLSTRATG
jgi:hypothetical protein